MKRLEFLRTLKKKIILLEWPKFKFELSEYHPLNINIEIISNNQSSLSEFRKISLSGSKKWDNKIKNLHNFLAL